MSSATHIPETGELDGERPDETLERVPLKPIVPKAWHRFRAADGFSYARSLGFQTVMAVLPGLIFFVAVAGWTGNEALVTAVEGMLTSLMPGPTAEVFLQAIQEAEDNARGNIIAMLAGGVAALVSGTVAMSQVAEGADRIYGIHRDRPPLSRYGVSLVLALGVGVLFVAAFFTIAARETFGNLVGDDSIWLWLRWPFGLVALVAAVATLYRVAPYRRQPPWSWLLVGGIIGTFLWIAASVGLTLYLMLSSTFGDVYGSLAGFIGLMLWAQFTGFALLGGIAFAAQVEAERCGVTEVSDEPIQQPFREMWDKVS